MAATTGEGAQRGRPRDPDFEDRVYDAAVQVYGYAGLDGFSIGAVARRARVGKASLYLRWPDRETLLREALDARIVLDTHIDTGDLRADLRRLAQQMLEMFWSDIGLAFMRRVVDATVHPEVFGFRHREGSPTVLAARRLVHNAVDRGDLPPGSSPTVLMDLLFGATMMHATVTPVSMRDKARARADDYLDELVDTILAGMNRATAQGGRGA
ncbi:TetR/AcrR family transcriptional regulator [Streptomyces sp. V3I7]|uniref:TetR/AcrR family transcriptional regulator n=1 Tax=Streptomyces sp. V3I7 TaxID=3042278 RepID=UPI002780DD8D|nr:TetR/AcrR family transcriptional regulator [Streptomyces sp. V3I7]MDQ0989337.1 AcrR family transcriptional regulator [Streptomyces sp. V3I7]